ncbi:afadin [Gadus macrocephalus]|uniref:afadin n=1 Tax=Gadus macrocephalus TaxID=80720 RepID=UPI0028CB989A|nr:afadin [Gadus macrocephalus]
MMLEKEEQQRLAEVIRQWNNNRLDLFEISQPDENLEFCGVVRFYLEDSAAASAATTCLRVSSRATAREVIDTLAEKFRPDMKMLSSSFCLNEVHAPEERRLDLEEKPLLVQLNWTSDNREGRFVLRRDGPGMEGSGDHQTNTIEKKEKGGVIETFKRTLSKKEKKKKKNKKEAIENGSTEGNRSPSQQSQSDPAVGLGEGQQPNQVKDHLQLPVEIQFSPGCEEAFISAVINYTNSSTVYFKLSPAYALYATARSALRPTDTEGPVPREKPNTVTAITDRMVAMTEKVIQKQHTMAGALSFWLANTSELLNFLQQDGAVGPLTGQTQQQLSHLVHTAYKYLIQCLQCELRKHLPTFFLDPDQYGPLPAGIEMVLNTLMNTMALLRRCQVNPALTIQLFSQLFHYTSAWLFNQLMGPQAGPLGLRSHYWGAALRQRLSAVEAWAERQGLELAADCHLGHIVQATMLLTMNKYSAQDTEAVQKTCFKLNSLQLHTLLTGYLYAPEEPRIPPALIDSVVMAAKRSADPLVASEGRCLEREERLELRLPFLLPDGGYSCDTVGGIPPGFTEFLEPICRKGLCKLTPRANCHGSWRVFFNEPNCPTTSLLPTGARREPEVVVITLRKPLNSGMGVSIVAARGSGQAQIGIYIKSIVQGGPAEVDGTLSVGDQLVSVDGRSLVGLNQERAAMIMVQTGPVVTLHVAKHAASCHGLEALINQPGFAPNTGDRGLGTPGGGPAWVGCSVPGPRPEPQAPGGSRGRRQQNLQRNRLLYRSNPNMSHCVPEEVEVPEEPVDGGPTISTLNLCTETFHREYQTLPSSRHLDHRAADQSQQLLRISLGPSARKQNPNMRTFMRQALSQENLCLDPRPAEPSHNPSTSLPHWPSASTHSLLQKPPNPPQNQNQPQNPTQYHTQPQAENPTQNPYHPQNLNQPENPTQRQNPTQSPSRLQNPPQNPIQNPSRPQNPTQSPSRLQNPNQNPNHPQNPSRHQYPTQNPTQPHIPPQSPSRPHNPTQPQNPAQSPSRPQNHTQNQNPTQAQNPEPQDVKSSAGVWRTPPSRTSTQPTRIDIPITRPDAPPRPLLSTFQHHPALGPVRSAQGGRRPVTSSPPSSTTPTSSPRPRQSAAPSQPQGAASSPQRPAPPTRHVSFQDPPPGAERPAPGGEGLSPDPWRREARERLREQLEEQRRRRELEALEEEVRELGARAARSPGDGERLRRLSLELQFQRRLQELQQNGGEEEEEEEEEEEFRVIPQRTENRLGEKSQVKEHQTTNPADPEGQRMAPDQKSIGYGRASHEVVPKKSQEDSLQSMAAPEKLPFKERQRLFSLGSAS